MKSLKSFSVFKSLKELNSNNSLLKRYLYECKTIRNLSFNINNNYAEEVNGKKGVKQRNYDIHPYRNLYEWSSMREFVQMLANNIVYNDGNLIAICKPWGVGTHRPEVTITDSNSHLLRGVYYGSAKYCIDECLQQLSQLIDVKRLKCVKTCDRFASGIILLVTNEMTEKRVIKAMNRSKPMEIPYMKFWCITKGWPVMDSSPFRERVGIKLIEVDEFGDHKEAIIISSHNLTNSMRRRQMPQSDGLSVKTVLCETKTLDSNKTLGAALVELSITTQKFHFIECYLSNKASFVLGDLRFSRRVKNVLGTPMSLDPNKLNFSDDFEPLPSELCRTLNVRGNSSVPLMIHHKSITLPMYLSKKDLIIDSNILPNHFMWTLNRLGLRVPLDKALTLN